MINAFVAFYEVPTGQQTHKCTW